MAGGEEGLLWGKTAGNNIGGVWHRIVLLHLYYIYDIMVLKQLWIRGNRLSEKRGCGRGVLVLRGEERGLRTKSLTIVIA